MTPSERHGRFSAKNFTRPRDDNDPERLTPGAQKEWLKILSENEWDPGAWMMTEKDNAQVFALLSWNPDKLGRAAHENSAFSVVCVFVFRCMSLNETNASQNLRANDDKRSGDVFVKQARPIAQPQPKYAQPPHFQYMLFPPADAQRCFERTTNVDNEEEKFETIYTDTDGDEGDANEEEESDVDDEISSDDVDEEKGDKNDKPIVRIISGPDVFPIILIEPFFEKRDFDFLESISPKIAKFARKSANRRLWDCHREAAHVMQKLTKRWLRELQNNRRDRELILCVEGYCEKRGDE